MPQLSGLKPWLQDLINKEPTSVEWGLLTNIPKEEWLPLPENPALSPKDISEAIQAANLKKPHRFYELIIARGIVEDPYFEKKAQYRDSMALTFANENIEFAEWLIDGLDCEDAIPFVQALSRCLNQRMGRGGGVY